MSKKKLREVVKNKPRGTVKDELLNLINDLPVEELPIIDELAAVAGNPRLSLKGGELTLADTGDLRSRLETMVAFLGAGGTDDIEVSALLISQLSNTLSPSRIDREKDQNGTVALLAEFHPRNSQEAMLASQMVSTHNTAMEFIKRAVMVDSVDNSVAHMNIATKMLKTFTTQMDVWNKIRGDKKTVVVKHVSVADGGQAVVGDIHHHSKEDTDGKK